MKKTDLPLTRHTTHPIYRGAHPTNYARTSSWPAPHFLAAAFFLGDFLAAFFLAAGAFLAIVFLGPAAFFAAGFFLVAGFFLAAPGLVDFLTVFFLVVFLAAEGFLTAEFFLVAALGFFAIVFLTGDFFLASGESLKDALTLMNMPLETPNLSAFLSARSFFAAGKFVAMYFLIAASEEPLRSLRPSRAALISSEYFGPSVFVVFLAGGMVVE